MPASWAKAFWPTIALFRCTIMPVMLATRRLVGTRRLRLHAGVGVVEVAARAQGHDDLFERAVAGPLAQPVDRALDLSGAGLDGGEAVGHGHPQVVVAVDADHGAVDVRHALAEGLDDAVHVAGRGVADGVGDVDRRRPGGNRRLDHLAEEIGLGAARRPRARTRRRGNSPPPAAPPPPRDARSRRGPSSACARDGWRWWPGRRGSAAARRGRTASHARSMSSSRQRASPQIVAPRTAWAISQTALKSPGEAMGKPASITSTPNSTRAWAISIFSARFMLAPGDCSPSRSVVSKMMIRREGFVSCRSCSFLVMGKVFRCGFTKKPQGFFGLGVRLFSAWEYCANLTANGWLKPATTTAKGCAKGSRNASPVEQSQEQINCTRGMAACQGLFSASKAVAEPKIARRG